MDLISALRAYRPWNPQEVRDTAELLRRLESGGLIRSYWGDEMSGARRRL